MDEEPAESVFSCSDLDLQLSQESIEKLWQELEQISPNGSFTTVVDQIINGNENPGNETVGEMNKFILEHYNCIPQVETMVSSSYINPSTSSSVATYTDLVTEMVNTDYSKISLPSPVLTHQSTLASCSLPATNNWLGQYGFCISFGPQEKPTKSTAWTYSEMKDKLYVNMGAACPVRFYTTHSPPAGSVLRAMAVFTKPEYVKDVVKRCLNHSSPSDITNENHPAPDHLVRCESPQAYYMMDSNSERQSVIVPYENPQVGMPYTTYLFKFMCLGSCVGGLNRRPIKIVFTLESKHGLCMGRQSVEVRICACPWRDRRTDEKHFEQQQKPRPQGLGVSVKRTCNDIFEEFVTVSPAPKKPKSTSEDDEIFTIKVRGRKNFEFMCLMRDALEKQTYLTPEQLKTYQQDKILFLSKPKQKSSKNSSGEETE